MKIVILTAGSHGDVLPHFVLGHALKQSGYEILVSAPKNYASLAVEYGVEYFPLSADIQSLVSNDTGRETLDGSKNLFAFVRNVREMVAPLLRQMARELWEASQGAQMLICHPVLEYFAQAISEKLRIPLLNATMWPPPTREFHHNIFPPPPAMIRAVAPGLYNRVSYRLINLGLLNVLRSFVNHLRRDILELPTKVRVSSVDQVPVLGGFSRNLIPPPSDWDERVHVTGYWYPRYQDWQPPDGLMHFLESGPPPVFMGFGSMLVRDPQENAKTLVKALEMTGQRGVLLSGWARMEGQSLPESVFTVDYAPYEWLFSHTAAVVHHGGVGTTHLSLRAGKPTVIVPFIVDQPFWGWRVEQLGVGPKAIPKKKLTAENLARALEMALSDREMQRRAAELGENMRAEDGLGAAVEIVGRYAQKGR